MLVRTCHFQEQLRGHRKEYSDRDCRRAPRDFPEPTLAVHLRCAVPPDTVGNFLVDRYRFGVSPNSHLYRSPVVELNCYYEKYLELVKKQRRPARLVWWVVADCQVELQELAFVAAVCRGSP